MTLLLTSVDLWVQSLSTCHCKLLSQKQRDFTHLVSKPCECVAIHYKHSRQMPWMLKINLTCLVMLYCFSSYFVIFVYTLLFLVILSLWRSIHKFKVRIAPLRRGFFILNLRCVLKLWIFRSLHSAQNDKRCRYFANAQYDKCLRFLPFTKAQNDKFFHKIALYRVKFAIFG